MPLFLLLLALLMSSTASVLPAQDFDVLIRNGRIVDGTGNPSFVADVAIQGGRKNARRYRQP
jgi:hypothetical protein